jgi:hypothetical protein
MVVKRVCKFRVMSDVRRETRLKLSQMIMIHTWFSFPWLIPDADKS